jgi:hypothetical protein
MTRAVEGLHGPGRGHRVGTRFLSSTKEALIREIIEREYLKPTRPPIRRVVEDIGLACRRHGWWHQLGARSKHGCRLSISGFRLCAGKTPRQSVPWMLPLGNTPLPGRWRASRLTTPRWMLSWSTNSIGKAMALVRVMAALAPRCRLRLVADLTEPIDHCCGAVRSIGGRRDQKPGLPIRAAFACWSVPAQLAAICLLEEVVWDDHAWGQIADRELVDRDDRNVIRDLLGSFDQAAEPRSRAPVAPDALPN